MRALRFLMIFSLAGILIGCNDPNPPEANDDINYSMISTNSSINQTAANQAKESLRQRDDITAIHAVNTDNKMILAFEIKHHKRFQLADLNKKIQKQLDEEFPDLDVEVSADKKLVLELKSLEKKINDRDISAKKLTKEVDRLINLKKDKT
ncbi:YhcN/YlaJ family sporulation lipoprotein [Lentibacillus amyloliquefaciens]|uniref:Sporulation protein n=1 Tax=Lentibacillus amyloliquefaciens TaxID=1472767 RepID=A0A0U4E9X0_9BACI|nr:YhcN/YlaJ family sporulation lipoprotein [Lentibacillus amyloliquefaciens]ALX47305.1 hypothetical protein AOX59_01045 [Lentibacillus amyloliquefaciens]